MHCNDLVSIENKKRFLLNESEKENINDSFLILMLGRSVSLMFIDQTEHLPYSVSTQSAISCSKLTIETLEEGVKYVQS